MNKRTSKITLGLLCIILVFSVVGVVLFGFVGGDVYEVHSSSVDFKVGDGTRQNPYRISTVAEFNSIRYHLDACFEQTENLDFAGSNNFSSIGSSNFPFTGSYDGKKYEITNITLNYSGEDNVGIFSFLSNGSIQNLKIRNAVVKGRNNVGGVVGVNDGEISGVVFNGKVEGSNFLGGIAGVNSNDGKIFECGNLGSVNFSQNTVVGAYSGGIAGANFSTVKNCYNHGSMNAQNDEVSTADKQHMYVGGIVGVNHGENYSAIISNCYNVGSLYGTARGQIAGDNLQGNITDCKWQTSELNESIAFDTGSIQRMDCLTAAEFQDKQSFANWSDFDRVWRYFEHCKYPLLQKEYVEVSSIEFLGGNNFKLMPGEDRAITPVVYPSNSTLREAAITVEAYDEDSFSYEQGILRVKENATIGKIFKVRAVAEKIEKVFTVEVVKIPLQKIEIFTENNRMTISAASPLQFGTNFYPENATYRDVAYSVSSRSATINSQGLMTLADDASIGTVICVTATATDNPAVKAYKYIQVVKEPVVSVTIISASQVKVSQELQLQSKILPEKATNKDTNYKIISSTAQNARISSSGILQADGVGQVNIIAVADGVSSAVFSVEILKEPVTSLRITCNDTLYCGKSLRLTAQVLPSNATYSNVTYEITGNNAVGARIVNGVLSADREGTVTVRATADGVIAELIITVQKIPVTSVEILSADTFKHTGSLPLHAYVAPADATYAQVAYTVLESDNNAKITNNTLYADKPGVIKLQAEADGVRVTKTINVLKESVVNVILVADILKNETQESWQFSAEVYPSNATYPNVEFQLVSGNADLDQNGLLLVKENTPRNSLIEVKAVADGVESKVYKFVSGGVLADSVSLSSDVTEINAVTNAILRVETTPSVVSNMRVTYEVIGAGFVFNDCLKVNENAIVGSTISVAAYVDGVRSNTLIFDVVKVPVTSIVFDFGNRLDSANNNYGFAANEFNGQIHFLVSDSLPLKADVQPSTATYKNIEYYILDDGGTGATIKNGKLVADMIGDIKLVLSADGVEEEIDVKVVKVKVTSVEFGCADSFEHTKSLSLDINILPGNATYQDITYKILSDFTSENLKNMKVEDGVLYVDIGWLKMTNGVVDKLQGTVCVQATVDGVTAVKMISVTKEMVTKISFDTPNESNYVVGANLFESFKIVFQTAVEPSKVNYQTINYTVISQDNVEVEIVNATLYLRLISAIKGANMQGKVTVQAECDGMTAEKTYNIIKTPVSSIEFVEKPDKSYNVPSLPHTQEFTLLTHCLPNNATFSAISYSFEFGDNIKLSFGRQNIEIKQGILYSAIDINGSFTACLNEKPQNIMNSNTLGSIKVTAYADNISASFKLALNKIPVDDFTLTGVRDFIPSESIEVNMQFLGNLNPTIKNFEFKLNDNVISGKTTGASMTVNDQTVKLSAEYAGVFELEAKSLCSGKIKTFTFTVNKEPVQDIYLGVTLSSTDGVTMTEEGSITETVNYTDADIAQYKTYKALEIERGKTIQVRTFACASSETVYATDGRSENFDYYISTSLSGGTSQLLNSNTSSNFVTISGNEITIRKNAPVGQTFYLFAKAKSNVTYSGSGESARIAITVLSEAMRYINKAAIDSNGLIIGLDNLDKSAVRSVDITITHSSGITITKNVKTSNPAMRLQLYNYYLGGTFSIGYGINFEETCPLGGTNKYTLRLPNVTTFNGIKSIYTTQSIETFKESIVMLDYSGIGSKAASRQFTVGKNVHVLYLYGNGSKYNFNLEINNNEKLDLFFNRFSIQSSEEGKVAIDISNKGEINFITLGEISICGRDAETKDVYGSYAIHCPNATLIIKNGGHLNITGGKGAMGDNGYSYKNDTKEFATGSATAKNGGDGHLGGGGGAGLYASGVVFEKSEYPIIIYGGDGNYGGNGGDGQGSDCDGKATAGRGGRGGDGGHGGHALVVNDYLYIKTDNLHCYGGNGGNGNYGGNGGFSTDYHDRDHGGDGGKGGRGGIAGSGIVAGNSANFQLNLSCTTLIVRGGKGGNGGYGGGGGKANKIMFDNPSNGKGGDGGNGANAGIGVLTSLDISYFTKFDVKIGEIGALGEAGSNGSGSGKSPGTPNSGSKGSEQAAVIKYI